MKQIFILICLFLAGTPTFSQTLKEEVNATFSPVEKMSMKKDYFLKVDVVADDAEGFYVIGTPFYELYKHQTAFVKKQPYRIVRFNNNMEGSASAEIELEDGDVERTYEFSFSLNGQIYIFTSFQNKDHKKTYLFVQSVDKATLALHSDVKKVAEIDYADENKYRDADFGFSISADGSKVLLFHSLTDKNDRVLRNGFDVYNANFEPLWKQKNVGSKKDTGIFSFQEYQVSNTGEVYLSGRTFGDEKDYSHHRMFKSNWLLSPNRTLQVKPVYKSTLLHYTKGKGLSREISLEIPGKFLHNVAYTIKKNQDILCTGLYSESGAPGISGSYVLAIAKGAPKVSKVVTQAFSNELMTQGMTEQESRDWLEKKANGDDYQYILSDIIRRKDGSYILVAEQLKHELKKKTVGQEVTYENHYQHHDLLVMNFAEEGSINWVQKIPKRQYAEELSVFYTSYALMEKENKLYFIYNDITKKDLNIAHWVKRSKVNMAELDKDGKMRQAELFNSEDTGINYRPTEFRKTADGSLVMYGQKKLKSGYLRLSVN